MTKKQQFAKWTDIIMTGTFIVLWWVISIFFVTGVCGGRMYSPDPVERGLAAVTAAIVFHALWTVRGVENHKSQIVDRKSRTESESSIIDHP